jgi:hypothetical protein
MKSENLLHVKLEYEEGVQSERDVLSSEKDILSILKTIKRYQLLRTEDLNNRLRIYKKMKDIELNITTIKIPDILKDEEEYRKEREEKRHGKKKDKDDIDLENQLRDIQERLKKLE